MKLYRFLSSLGFCLLAVNATYTQQGRPARGVGVYQPITGRELELAQQQYLNEVARRAKELNFDASPEAALLNPTTWANDFIVIYAQPDLHVSDYSLAQRKIDEAGIAQALTEVKTARNNKELAAATYNAIVERLAKKKLSPNIRNRFNKSIMQPVIESVREDVIAARGERRDERIAIKEKARAKRLEAERIKAEAESKAAAETARIAKAMADEAAESAKLAQEEADRARLAKEAAEKAEKDAEEVQRLQKKEAAKQELARAAEALRNKLNEEAVVAKLVAEQEAKKLAAALEALVAASKPVLLLEYKPTEEELEQTRQAAAARSEKAIQKAEERTKREAKGAATSSTSMLEAVRDRIEVLREATKSAPSDKPATGVSPESVPAATVVVHTPGEKSARKPVIRNIAKPLGFTVPTAASAEEPQQPTLPGNLSPSTKNIDD